MLRAHQTPGTSELKMRNKSLTEHYIGVIKRYSVYEFIVEKSEKFGNVEYLSYICSVYREITRPFLLDYVTYNNKEYEKEIYFQPDARRYHRLRQREPLAA